jgi:membrane peptidoglycan carboxypeptidase
MAGVYATLDNHGKQVTPSIVKSAEHKDTQVDLPDPIGKQVLTRETADTVTKVLQGVVSNGSGSVVDTDAYHAAGKTGTSENNKSAWFVGYTPQITTAVALFGESPKDGGGQVTLTGTANSGRANGGGFPAKIWADYTLAALNGGSDVDFDLEAAEAVREEPSEPAEESTPEESPSDEPSDSPSEEAPEPSFTPPSDPPSESESGDPQESPSDSASTDPGNPNDPSDDPSSLNDGQDHQQVQSDPLGR